MPSFLLRLAYASSAIRLTDGVLSLACACIDARRSAGASASAASPIATTMPRSVVRLLGLTPEKSLRDLESLRVARPIGSPGLHSHGLTEPVRSSTVRAIGLRAPFFAALRRP